MKSKTSNIEKQIMSKLQSVVHEVVTETLGSGDPPKTEHEAHNGVRAPDPKSMCGRLWHEFDQLQKKGQATLSSVKQLAQAKDMNPTTARVQLYQWRKFHGLQGTGKDAMPQGRVVRTKGYKGPDRRKQVTN